MLREKVPARGTLEIVTGRGQISSIPAITGAASARMRVPARLLNTLPLRAVKSPEAPMTHAIIRACNERMPLDGRV